MEELAQGTAQPRSARRVIAITVLAALLLGVGVWIDARWRSSTQERLTATEQQARAVVDSGQRRINTMRDYVQPAVSRPDLDPTVREEMAALVLQTRDEVREEAEELRRQLADIRVAPWHTDLETEREAIARTLDAQIATWQALTT